MITFLEDLDNEEVAWAQRDGNMDIKIKIDKLNFYYGKFHALKDVSLDIEPCAITAMIGPSGCGKTTLLKVLNRMTDIVEGTRAEGKVLLDGTEIYARETDLTELRKKVGMVFQRPNPFPFSVYENVAYGMRIHGESSKDKIELSVKESLNKVGLWEELKEKMQRPALSLSLEQQQRLCIARLLAVEPDVLLMDEPCSALDPLSTLKIEELLKELKNRYTIVIVTHNMQQAARISDTSAFMLLGELVEYGKTVDVFTNPRDKKTEDYVTGRFG